MVNIWQLASTSQALGGRSVYVGPLCIILVFFRIKSTLKAHSIGRVGPVCAVSEIGRGARFNGLTVTAAVPSFFSLTYRAAAS